MVSLARYDPTKQPVWNPALEPCLASAFGDDGTVPPTRHDLAEQPVALGSKPDILHAVDDGVGHGVDEVRPEEDVAVSYTHLTLPTTASV